MNGIWQSLLWKEWREHRWSLAALVVIMTFAPVLMSIREPGNIFGAVTYTLVFAVPLASMFVGMGIAAGEQSRGTIRFLHALPTPMARPAAAKILWAAITVILPVAAATSLAAIWKAFIPGTWGPDDIALARIDAWPLVWGTSSWYAGVLVAGALGGVSVVLWMAAAGVNRSDEVRAGAVGMLVVLLCWAPLMATMSLLPDFGSAAWVQPRWHRILCTAAPGGLVTVTGPPQIVRGTEAQFEAAGWFRNYWPFVAVALVSHGAVVGWYLTKFGRIAAPRRSNEECVSPTVKTPVWLAPPRRSPLAAIVWKQFRETAPLAAMGAAVIILAAAWAAVENYAADELTEVAIAFWLAIGAFVATVAGVGLFMDDLRPGLHTFWRSRPISIRQYFVVKFAIGAAATLGILGLPVVTLLLFLREPPADLHVMAVVGAMMQFGLFAAGVAAMTLVRQALYAAILAIGLSAGYAVTVLETLDAVAPGWNQRIWLEPLLLFAAPTVLATIVAWLAVRNDWGWKG